jgi:flagellar basal body-associated protein FliL
MKLPIASVVLSLALVAAMTPAHASEAAPKEESKTERRITSAATYIPSPDLAAPITANYVFAGLLVVDAGYDVPDAKLRARVSTLMPRLTDALRTALATYTYARYRAGGAPDADRIAQELQAACDKTLGQAGAKVLLANVMVQKGR